VKLNCQRMRLFLNMIMKPRFDSLKVSFQEAHHPFLSQKSYFTEIVTSQKKPRGRPRRKLIPLNKANLEKLIISEPFSEPENSLPCPRESFIRPHPEPLDCSPHSQALKSTLISSFHLRLGIP